VARPAAQRRWWLREWSGRPRIRDRWLGAPARELLRGCRREAELWTGEPLWVCRLRLSLDCVSVFAAPWMTLYGSEHHQRVDPLDATTVDRAPHTGAEGSCPTCAPDRRPSPGVLPADLDAGVALALRRTTSRSGSSARRFASVAAQLGLRGCRPTTSSRPRKPAANLARYDGVRYRAGGGLDPRRYPSLYRTTRGEGFGEEVRRRILVGTYVV